METISFKEDHISQIPALQMLIKLGYTYLSPIEALQYRWDKTTNVILEDILRRQLKEINSIKVWTTKTSYFTDANIEAGTGRVLLGEEYVTRILDNIASNIIKHGDRKRKVTIKTEYADDGILKLIIVNGLTEDGIKESDSHGIGLKNIGSLMKKMGGKMATEIVDNSFQLTLTFVLKS